MIGTPYQRPTQDTRGVILTLAAAVLAGVTMLSVAVSQGHHSDPGEAQTYEVIR